jgi:hypothetical protein
MNENTRRTCARKKPAARAARLPQRGELGRRPGQAAVHEPGGGLPPAAAGDFEGGNAGETAGRNSEQMEEVTRKPGEGEAKAPRA